jgi:hypothetical protein
MKESLWPKVGSGWMDRALSDGWTEHVYQFLDRPIVHHFLLRLVHCVVWAVGHGYGDSRLHSL